MTTRANSASIQRDIGSICARLMALEKAEAEAKEDRKAMAANIQQMRDLLSRAQGGWRAIAAIAGIAAAVGAAAARMIPMGRF